MESRRKGKFCGAMTDTLEERFWSRVQKGDGCWPWTWGKDRDGYGRMRYKFTNHRAHRLSWQLHFGEIPSGMVVCHRCDNPPCVRPDHLFLGSNQDNQADKAAKGRVAGTKNPRAVLIEADIPSIRAIEFADTATKAAIAEKHGISVAAINDILRRRSWRHI